MIRALVKYPDPRLSQICQPVGAFSAGHYDELIRDMFFVMSRHNGIGLAAPQLGLMIRLVVIGLSGNNVALINPEIIYRHGTTKMKEGCLSYPGRQVFVQRSATIRVRALNPAAEPIEFKASKMFARVIQHELDHLDGICKVAPK